jgi:hypothetical protein
VSHNTQGQIRIGWGNSAAYYAAALEEIAGSKNMTATDKQFAEYLQSIARKALDDNAARTVK